MALGVTAVSRQNQERIKAEEQGEPPEKRSVPAGPAAAAIVVICITGSVLVHTKFSGVIG